MQRYRVWLSYNDRNKDIRRNVVFDRMRYGGGLSYLVNVLLNIVNNIFKLF